VENPKRPDGPKVVRGKRLSLLQTLILSGQRTFLRIEEYITHHNVRRKPFFSTATANTIMAKVTRVRKALNKTRTA
jgi:hypothetical protein